MRVEREVNVCKISYELYFLESRIRAEPGGIVLLLDSKSCVTFMVQMRSNRKKLQATAVLMWLGAI